MQLITRNTLIAKLWCVILFCAANAFAGVSVYSPTDGSTTSTHVHVTAAATPASTAYHITAMKIYLDYQAAYTVFSNKIDTYLTVGVGSHYLVVLAWDSANTQYTSKLHFTAASTAPVGITLSPSSSALQVSATQQFAATVSGTTNTGVIWKVAGVQDGNTTVGTISSSGLYTAPASVPSPSTVAVTATSAADSSKSATANVSISAAPVPVKVGISPASSTVQAGKTQQFTATVTGCTNTGVIWSVAGVQGGNATVGTISTSGLYQAPANVPSTNPVAVTARSSYDSTALANASVTIAVSTVAPAPSGSGVPAAFFSMTMGHLLDYNEPWPTVPVGGIRLWDTGTAWSALEPSRGSFSWAKLDTWFNQAQSHNVDINYVFGHTPSWAAASCSGNAPDACPPANITDWDNFVRALVTHASGRIKYYELWNEFNDHTATGFWSGTIYQMATMAQHAYSIIKSLDPNAIVLAPSTTGSGGWAPNYLECYLKPAGQACPSSAYLSSSEMTGAGGGQYADGITFHSYVGSTAETVAQSIDYYRTAMKNAGVSGKPVFDTEGSWGTTTSLPNDDAKVAYIARTHLVQYSKGVARFWWYAWDNSVWGTLWSQTTGITPEGVAYGETAKWMTAATLSSACTNNGGIWTCGFTRSNNYQALAIWNVNGSSTYTPAIQYMQWRDLAGGRHAISPGSTVTIGTKPILLETGSAW
jgi:hypothetical protein